MAEETKPTVPAAEPVVAAPAAVDAKPAEAVAAEPATDAAPKAEESAKDAAEGVKDAAKEPPKPIYDGILGYSDNALKSILPVKQKFHFYFGDDAVEAEKLKHLSHLPGMAHTAAWSNETGKGLLYFVKGKDQEQKSTPHGVINLSEIEHLAKGELKKISFKFNGNKHTLVAENATERDSWYAAFQEKVDQAKQIKDDIVSKDSFKETLEKFAKPAAAVGAAATALPKKSTDSKSERAARSETSDKKRSAKERSQSRGKKFFDQFRAKKDEVKEEIKDASEGKDEAKPAETAAEPAAAAETTEAPVAAAVPEATAVTDETKAEEKEEAKKEAPPPNKSRRSSKFIDYIKTIGSPKEDKKQEDLIPPTETAEPSATTAVTDTVTEPAVEAKAVDAKPEVTTAEPVTTAPATNGDGKPTETKEPSPTETKDRRRASFFSGFAGTLRKPMDKVEKKVEATKEEVKPAEEAKAEDVKPAEDAKVEEPKEVKPAATEPKKESRLIGLLRNPSKAIRGNKEARKEKAKAPEKVEETPETKVAEAKPADAAVAKEEKKTEAAVAAPATIGDVGPEAVTVGTAPPTNPTVQATA